MSASTSISAAAGSSGTAAAADAAQQLAHSFKAAMASVRRLRGRETHRPGELSNAQYALLFSLSEVPALSVRELAYAAALTSASVTQMLEPLEAQGLVRRTRSDADKRIVLTELTNAGRERVAERRARVEPLWCAALAEFSESELRTTAAVLDRLAEHFDALAGRSD